MPDAPLGTELAQVTTLGEGGQGSTATQASQTPATNANLNASQSTQTAQTTTWSPGDESLNAKGWKSQADMAKSYKELESDRSQRLAELQRYAAFIERLEPYAAYIQNLLEGKKFAFNGVDSKVNEPDPVKEQLAPIQNQIRAQQEAFVANVRSESIDKFFADHPEARQLENEMAEVIRSGVVQVSELTKSASYLEAFRAALAVVKANRAPKEGAAARAASVSGTGRAAETGNLTDSQARWKMGPDALLAGIKSGQVR